MMNIVDMAMMRAAAVPTPTLPTNGEANNEKPPAILGLGYDSIEGRQQLQSAITFTAAVEPMDRFDLRVEEVTGSESLNTALSRSASAAGWYGIVSAALSYSETVEDQFNSASLYFMVYLYVLKKRAFITKVTATEDAIQTVEQDPNAFFNYYGDCFTAEVGLGGYVIGVLRYQTYSSEHKKQVRADLEAAVGTWSRGDLSQQTAIERLSAHASTSLGFTGQGIAPAAIPTSLEDLRTKMAAIPQKITESPLYYAYQRYNEVKGLRSPDLSEPLENLANLREMKDELQVRRNTLKVVQRSPEFFEKYERDVGELLVETYQELEKVNTAIQKIRTNPFRKSRRPQRRQLTPLPEQLGALFELSVVHTNDKPDRNTSGIVVGILGISIWKLKIQCLAPGVGIQYSGYRKADVDQDRYYPTTAQDGEVLFDDAPVSDLCDLHMSLTGPNGAKWRLCWEAWGIEEDEYCGILTERMKCSFRGRHDRPVCQLRVWLEPRT